METGLQVHVMSYPTLEGVMTIANDTWVGVGRDPEGMVHVLAREVKGSGRGGSTPATWYTLETYPEHLREVVEHLQAEL